jgi:hypothetical protein
MINERHTIGRTSLPDGKTRLEFIGMNFGTRTPLLISETTHCLVIKESGGSVWTGVGLSAYENPTLMVALRVPGSQRNVRYAYWNGPKAGEDVVVIWEKDYDRKARKAVYAEVAALVGEYGKMTRSVRSRIIMNAET